MNLTPEDELKEVLAATKETVVVSPTPIIPAAETTTATPAATTRPEAQKHHPSFWGDATIERKQPEISTGAALKEIPNQPAGPSANRVTRDAISTSARTAVATINLAQLTLMRPLLNWRFKKECEKRFGEHLPRVQEMVMGDVKPTDESERARKVHFQKFLDQRDRKIIDIPFSDEEEQDMERAFKAYFEMKQTTMSPEVLLYCSLGSTLGKRGIDALMWD